ncbi:MAG: DDE-type integrase/transposase/recombinase [Sphingomonas sp.]|uniref:DDE-type integrase/transposase/recombinase n=1 Tax=Sphingomonas sp. TaxID=28214 RepID=UPI0025D39781|nr:DDE-type integrase/transposase/recombinase [Sphingomonas sp.]MBX3565568.1 DDE-type integrase/transposase/recombinase [Sphingomonas sp.]
MKLNGEMVYILRAADHEGGILERFATRTRDKDAAMRFMRKALKRHGAPENITTDGLRSYRAAMTELRMSRSRRLDAGPTIGLKTATSRSDDRSAPCFDFEG